MKSLKNICIIPAKGYSERLPKKNILLLGDKPLVGYTIECAQQTGLFDRIIVSTESEEVAEVIREYGADIPYIRPQLLAENTKGVPDVCIDVLLHLGKSMGETYETLFILLPTSPFRKPEYIIEAYEKFCSSPNDILMSFKQSSGYDTI